MPQSKKKNDINFIACSRITTQKVEKPLPQITCLIRPLFGKTSKMKFYSNIKLHESGDSCYKLDIQKLTSD